MLQHEGSGGLEVSYKETPETPKLHMVHPKIIKQEKYDNYKSQD